MTQDVATTRDLTDVDDAGVVPAVDVSADIARFAAMGLLSTLLADRSTGGNIIWASSVYVDKGASYAPTDEILVSDVTGDNVGLIRTRASKAREAQAALTRAHAEVFTPTWIVDKMVDAADEAWWAAHESATWRDYVSSPRLEITCGEAPYLVGRYDAADGAPVPLEARVGILDRKLRLVGEHTTARKTWVKYANMALKSTYGYEYQGDNLLIARVNVLATLEEFARDAGYALPASTYRKFATVISWNLWQMDGLSDRVPDMDNAGCEHVEDPDPFGETPQLTGFDEWYASAGNEVVDEVKDVQEDVTWAKVRDWDSGEVVCFADLKKEGSDMKFDYVIGNPPYQEDTEGTSDKQIYWQFMDAAFETGRVVELITPGKFLFDAGNTPSQWNQKMLKDEHFKVLRYFPHAKDVFPSNDIKGGISITLRDSSRVLGPVGTFTVYDELNSILQKVMPRIDKSLDDFIYLQAKWDLNALYAAHPECRDQIGSKGRERRLTTSIFTTVDCFSDAPSGDCFEVLGLINNVRYTKYILKSYIDMSFGNVGKYKVVLPKSNGSGALGETLSNPLVGTPSMIFTQSFISFGAFDTEEPAQATLKYIKTKFVRALLGSLKITQDNNKGRWANVPLQDFTSDSDIDWSKPISDIDQQLYRKYGLSDEEIAFIESHVKEMS